MYMLKNRIEICRHSSVVERIIGNDEVASPILADGTVLRSCELRAAGRPSLYLPICHYMNVKMMNYLSRIFSCVH
jgi:hypothetical protein